MLRGGTMGAEGGTALSLPAVCCFGSKTKAQIKPGKCVLPIESSLPLPWPHHKHTSAFPSALPCLLSPVSFYGCAAEQRLLLKD